MVLVVFFFFKSISLINTGKFVQLLVSWRILHLMASSIPDVLHVFLLLLMPPFCPKQQKCLLLALTVFTLPWLCLAGYLLWDLCLFFSVWRGTGLSSASVLVRSAPNAVTTALGFTWRGTFATSWLPFQLNFTAWLSVCSCHTPFSSKTKIPAENIMLLLLKYF